MAHRACLAAVVGVVALVGCGDDPAGEEQLVGLSQSAVQRCAALAPRRAIAVLCPSRLPRARWYVRHQTLRSGRLEYLTNLDTKPAGSGDPFHALAGGRRGRFSLKTAASEWPVDAGLARDLGLVGARSLKPGQRHDEQRPVRLTVVRRARVARHRALLLEAADYPQGGVHGGHLAVVWNQRGTATSCRCTSPSAACVRVQSRRRCCSRRPPR